MVIKMTLRRCALFTAPWLIAGTLDADCVFNTTAIEVQIEACVPAVALATERIKGQFPWVRAFILPRLGETTDVALVGRVLREARVEIYESGESALTATEVVAREGAWVVGPSGADCAELTPGAVLHFLAPKPCCDVIPPDDTACLLDIGYVEPLDEPLLRQFGSQQ